MLLQADLDKNLRKWPNAWNWLHPASYVIGNVRLSELFREGEPTLLITFPAAGLQCAACFRPVQNVWSKQWSLLSHGKRLSGRCRPLGDCQGSDKGICLEDLCVCHASSR